MSPAIILAALSAIETIIQDTPQAIALFNSAKAVLTQSGDPTADQWATLLTAMSAAHAKVQAG